MNDKIKEMPENTENKGGSPGFFSSSDFDPYTDDVLADEGFKKRVLALWVGDCPVSV